MKLIDPWSNKTRPPAGPAARVETSRTPGEAFPGKDTEILLEDSAELLDVDIGLVKARLLCSKRAYGFGVEVTQCDLFRNSSVVFVEYRSPPAKKAMETPLFSSRMESILTKSACKLFPTSKNDTFQADRDAVIHDTNEALKAEVDHLQEQLNWHR